MYYILKIETNEAQHLFHKSSSKTQLPTLISDNKIITKNFDQLLIGYAWFIIICY